MADNSFLSQFNGDDKKEKIVPISQQQPTQVTPIAPTPVPKAPGKGIKAPDHLVVQDQGFHQRKIVKMSIIGAAVIIVSILAFFGFRMARSVEVMDFTGMNWNQATQWGLSNGISIQRNDEYNLEFDEGVVFDQQTVAGSTIQRGAVIILDVSLGANMTEVLTLPNFEDMTFAQTNTWRSQMRAVSAITTREAPHATIPAGQFIELEHPTNVDLDNFTRRDSLTVYFSSGPRTMTMPNFVGRTREDVEEWAEDNDLTVRFVEEIDEEVDAGQVLAQNIAARERFTDEEIVITVSAGEAVTIPNFAVLAREDITELTGMTVVIRERFSTTVPFGRLIEQSIEAGTEFTGETPRVVVTFSVGRPFMPNLIGQGEETLPQFFFDEFTSRGANITYTIQYVDSYEPRGSITYMSQYAAFIGMNDHIWIHVSRGNLQPPAPPAPPAPEVTPPPAPEPQPEYEGGYENGDNGYGDTNYYDYSE